MKAKTKRQKSVMSLSKSLPKLCKRDAMWADRESFRIVAFKRGNTKHWCSECGQSFDSSEQPKECPHCKLKFHETVESSRLKEHWRNYYVIADVRSEWQVLRYFRIDKNVRKGMHAECSHWEVMQLWFSKGKYVCVARQRTIGFNVDSFSYSSKLEVREIHASSYGPLNITDIPYSAIKFKNILPSIRYIEDHVGEFSSKYEFSRKDLYVLMTAHPMAETIMKLGRLDILDAMLTRNKLCDSYFTAVKIALRNGYDFGNDIYSWLDYISQLIYLQKDIHNAHYVCPNDLHEAHRLAGVMCSNKYERASHTRKINAEKRRIEREKRFERIYKSRRSKFFGLKLSDGTIEIRVLPTVASFVTEADVMGHCVYRNRYYEKKDSLIMSARIKDKRIETVEVDLQKYRVLQSRGKGNQPSKYHQQILDLLESNMSEIENINNSRKYRKKVLKVG